MNNLYRDYQTREKNAARKNISALQRKLWRSRFLLNMPEASNRRILLLIKYWRKRL